MRISQQNLPLFDYDVPSKERLPTNTLSHQYRVQRWANFIAGYSVEFVEQCLENRDKWNDSVIDPFLGCGTTLVAAKNMGFRGYGFDRHPVYFNLAKAKLGNYSIQDINKVKAKLLDHTESTVWSENALKFLSKLFSNKDLLPISRASRATRQFKDRLQPLAIALFLKSCEASCGAQTDGIYKAPTSTKKKIPFRVAIDRAYEIFREDIDTDWYKEHWVEQSTPTCYNKSSTEIYELDNESIGICITSPPYLNNFDYAEMTRMHLYLLGWAGSWGEISKSIRNNLITNTTTALKGKKNKNSQDKNRSMLPHELLEELDEIVSLLSDERKIRAGKKEYDYLIYPYYSEITKVLTELYRTLQTGGEIHWVVADAALYGVHIKTHLHTAEIMREIGFNNVSVEFLRKRGHRWILNKRDGAKEGLGEYHIKAMKA